VGTQGASFDLVTGLSLKLQELEVVNQVEVCSLGGEGEEPLPEER
jgi:hypothetical protein